MKSDQIGIACSALCSIHCLATPFLAFFSPALAHYFDSHYIHIIFFIFVVFFAFIAFKSQFKVHKNKTPMLFAFSGISLLTIGLFSEHSHYDHLENILNIIGSSLLIIGHFFNIKYSKTSKCNHA